MKKLIFLFALIQVNLVFGQSPSDSIGIELREFMQKSKIPGIGVSIVSDEKILYTKGFGFRDLENKLPYDAETIQSVASISKTVIGIALIQLVEAGKIDLQADINTFLPFKVINPRFPNCKITLFHLATHTSSITDTYKAESAVYYMNEKDVPKKQLPKAFFKDYKYYLKTKPIDYQEYLRSYLSIDGEEFQKAIFGKYKPGEQYSYSNIGATLVAYIIEEVSGQTFEEYTQRHIFEPLKMNDTAWKKDEIKSENKSKIYLENGVKVPEYTFLAFPVGGLHTNSKDLAKFMLETVKGYNGKGELLNAESYKYMMSNHLKRSIEKSSGLLWQVNREGTNIGHTGSNFGIICRMAFNPELNKCIFLTMNISMEGSEELTRDHITLLQILSKYAKKLE